MKHNPYESGLRKVIPAVLVYLWHEGQILMIHRKSSDPSREDYHEGKWNGLGGKCELDESPLEAAHRELKEESGLDLTQSQFKPLGVVHFPNFKAHKNEDWTVFVFMAELASGASGEGLELQNLLQRNPEGELHWVKASNLKSLNLWPGDRYFLDYVLNQKPFMGTIWYEGPQVIRHWIQALD